MKIKLLHSTLALSFAVLFNACSGGGGGGDSSSSSASTVTGTFIDSAVSGLTYVCSSGSSGTTSSSGVYTCEEGDSVTFYIGSILIGSTTASATPITPLTFYPSDSFASTNMAQLLQTLDDNNNTDDGIALDTTKIQQLVDANISLDFKDADFDTTISAILGSIVSNADAKSHLDETVANIVSEDITDVILVNRSGNCEDYINYHYANVTDIQENTDFTATLTIALTNGKCKFTSNSIPNHDFNDDSAHFATKVSENTINVEITASPEFATSPTTLAVDDNGIMLNGVKLSLLSAGCYGVEDGKTGCHDENQPFRYDPMSPLNNFGTDTHNAHTQPGGRYHYHGSPEALFDTNGNSVSPVIGFARDGYPIYGKYFNDGGTIRKAESSYTLKSGTRSAVTYNGERYNPGGSYDGTYIDDWEYSEGEGDLDECNGMTVDGTYGYYVTDTFPWVLNCYKGTPDSSFDI
jgi:hypothetical protein